jgi:hypothetical protein
MNRNIVPGDIALPPGYTIEPFLTGLNTPIDMEFTDDGSLYIGDAGVADGNGKLLRYRGGRFETVASGFTPPLTGITPHGGMVYVSHRGSVTAVRPDGSKTNVLVGLPSWGDHHNNKVVFGTDGSMYYGQGTATNSGVAGEDNSDWIKRYPSLHDLPGQAIRITGANFATRNILNPSVGYAYTGPFLPYGTPASAGETIPGSPTPSGSIMRAGADGSSLTSLAWGLRNPFRIRFDRYGRLFVANHGMDARGSRPVATVQQLPHPFGRVLPPPDVHERADHVPHHVMQKGICAEIKRDIRTVPVHRGLAHDAYRGLGLTFRRSKSGEIVLTHQ